MKLNVAAQLPWSRALARRGLLVLAVVAMVALAGCTGVLTNSGEDANPQMEKVPNDAAVVATLDVSIASDSETQALIEGIDGSEAEDVQDVDEAYEAFENETGLDLAALDGVTMFATSAEDLSESGDAAFLLDADWDAETVVEMIEDEAGIDYVRTEYAGEEVLWEPAYPDQHREPMDVGVHDDGRLVIGDRAAVAASLDVSYAGAASLSGDLLDAFEDAPDGHVQFAMDASAMDAGAGPDQLGGGVATSDSLETVSGAYYTENGTVGVAAKLTFEEADQAENMKFMAELALNESASDYDPERQQLLEDAEFETQGSSLVVTWEGNVDELAAAANET